MTKTAHQQGVKVAVKKSKPIEVSVNQIAAAGYPLQQYADVEKVQRMRQSIRAGDRMKPVRLTPLTPENRDQYGVTDPNKKWFLNNGHHRLAAQALEGVKQIRAVSYMQGKRI
jgi:hypothetical protein